MSANINTVGELVSAFLESVGVELAFGVISIHNMPILDAIGRRNKIRYISSRGEAGAVNMADAASRIKGFPAVAFTSTGTAAGNAAGALIEAQTAGTPLLHFTGQIETPYLDRNLAYIHEAKNQLGMLKSVSKAAYRIPSPEEALPILEKALKTSLSAPTGPVSLEIPIDVQAASANIPDRFEPVVIEHSAPEAPEVKMLADRITHAKRPLLWLGGGARHAGKAIDRFVEMGFGIVTSTQGRGIVNETHPSNLGAFNMHKPIETFYGTCDAIIVVGSRLRGNETLKYTLKLPQPLFQIDADETAQDRMYSIDQFICGDSEKTLNALADQIEGKMSIDPSLIEDLKKAKASAIAVLEDNLGPYKTLVEAIQAAVEDDFIWVRDVTILNSIWGNRCLNLNDSRAGVHALGGGIGQGLAMGVGAALAAETRKTLVLCGDGGFQLNLGELATAVQEQADFVLILMNSKGYGVIKNIQDVHYGKRNYYVDILTPNFSEICKSMGVSYRCLNSLDDAENEIRHAFNEKGPSLIEINMEAIGDFKTTFAGPPIREKD